MPTRSDQRTNTALEYFVWTALMPAVLAASVLAFVHIGLGDRRYEGLQLVLFIAAFLLIVSVIIVGCAEVSENQVHPDSPADHYVFRVLLALASVELVLFLWINLV